MKKSVFKFAGSSVDDIDRYMKTVHVPDNDDRTWVQLLEDIYGIKDNDDSSKSDRSEDSN